MVAQEEGLYVSSARVSRAWEQSYFFYKALFSSQPRAFLFSLHTREPWRKVALFPGSLFLFSTHREKVTFDLGYHERLVFLQVDPQTSVNLTSKDRYCVTVWKYGTFTAPLTNLGHRERQTVDLQTDVRLYSWVVLE